LLVDGQQLGKPDQIVAAILVFAIIGKLSDGLLVALSAPLVAWQDSFRKEAT
jgi:sulfonate transport system permease protein